MGTASTSKSAPTILSFFGPIGTIADIISKYDFSSIDLQDKTNNEYLHCDLAPSFGELNKDSVKYMDDHLKIMIAGTMRDLAKIKDRSWENIVSAMMQNSLLEPMESGEIHRADKFIKVDDNFFRFSGAPDEKVVKEVYTWYTNFVGDADILNCTSIKIDTMSAIVGQTGATITNFVTFFSKHERHERTVLDVGVLRYPDAEHPYFKLYRLKVSAWSDCTRVLAYQKDANGMTIELDCRRFKPRSSIMDALSEETKKKAINEAESLFD